MSLIPVDQAHQQLKELSSRPIGAVDYAVVPSEVCPDDEIFDTLRRMPKVVRQSKTTLCRSVTVVNGNSGEVEVHLPLGVPLWLRNTMEATARNKARKDVVKARLVKKLKAKA